jgi:hypothetical protein
MLLTQSDFIMEVRVFRGFAGITLAEPALVVLTPEQVNGDKTLLLELGAGTSVNGVFAPTSVPNLHHYVIYSELVKRGRTHAQIGQVLGLSEAEIAGFASNPINVPKIRAWNQR